MTPWCIFFTCAIWKLIEKFISDDAILLLCRERTWLLPVQHREISAKFCIHEIVLHKILSFLNKKDQILVQFYSIDNAWIKDRSGCLQDIINASDIGSIYFERRLTHHRLVQLSSRDNRYSLFQEMIVIWKGPVPIVLHTSFQMQLYW